MTVIDLLVTIIVVTILVTIALGVMTYIAYKLRLTRRPAQSDETEVRPRYFVVHEPRDDLGPGPTSADVT